MRVKSICTLLIILFFCASRAFAQKNLCPSTEKPGTNCAEVATRPGELALSPQQVHKEHPRLFWIIPTYSVANNPSSSRLWPHDKFRIFAKEASDPYTLSYAVAGAGLSQASNGLSGYGQGAAGYAKRLGAGLADQTSAGFFATYLFPSLLHQDPRYFRAGSGSFRARLMHAMIRPVVTRRDLGGRGFNWSGVLGEIAASSLSNAYYPASDRGVGATFRRAALAIPFSAADHLLDEFGPDLEKRLLHKK